MLIVLWIIVVVIWACILIAKTCFPHKTSNSETIVNNNDWTVTHEGTVSLEITSPKEEPADQKRAYTPAEIKKIFEENGTTYLTLDILTINKDFQPGVTDFFINQNPKLRDIAINENTKAYDCGAGPDNNATTPDVSVSVQTVLDSMQQWLATSGNWPLTYYFDIKNNTINTIYQQCLP